MQDVPLLPSVHAFERIADHPVAGGIAAFSFLACAPSTVSTMPSTTMISTACDAHEDPQRRSICAPDCDLDMLVGMGCPERTCAPTSAATHPIVDRVAHGALAEVTEYPRTRLFEVCDGFGE